MNINVKTAGGFLLIVFGLSVFFGGGHFAFIIPLAIGGLMLYWGIKRFSKGRAVSGIIAGFIGAMILVGSLPFIVAIGLAKRHGVFRVEDDEAGRLRHRFPPV